MSAQFLHNNLVKFCCARLNVFKLCILKTLILKGLNRYDLLIVVRPLKRAGPLVLIVCVLTLFGVCMVMGMAVTTFLLSHVVIPSIYLKTNVIIESGNGSSTNPYILSLDV